MDSVYFLLSKGLYDELESNRWHFARRWARHLPVTLLEPSQRFSFPEAKPVTEIPNCEILPIVRPNLEAADPLAGLIQAGKVMQHMRERGHTRPLLWSYNPRLAGLYAAVPAVGRVYHATESHFDFEHLTEYFHRELEASIRISDVVISVSSGVADSIRSRVSAAHLAVVTNGCDTRQYPPTGPGSRWMAEARDGFARVAVFAGNINSRLDFELIEKAASANPTTLIVIVGPVASLPDGDLERWRRISSLENVRHLGPMGPEDLAALYRSSDVGFIPYRRERLWVQSGFPLKTLEMAATGLPVVASYMKPIVGLASAIAVTVDDEHFLHSFASLSRSSLTDEEQAELREVSAANDYDRKFEEVAACVAGSFPTDRGVHTRLDALILELGYEPWAATCTRIFNRFAAPSVLAFVHLYDRMAAAFPARSRRLVPRRFKDYVRSRRPG